MHFVVGLIVLAAFAAALLNDQGRKVIATMIAIVVIGIGLLILALKSNGSRQSNDPVSMPSTSYEDAIVGDVPVEMATESQGKPDIELADEAFIEKRYSDAAALYQKIKIGPNGIALGRLAWMHYNGNGVPQNYATAYKLYPKAAALGDPESQAVLGYFYGNGIGFEKDILQAYVWSSVSAAQGNQTGSSNRDLFEQQMTPEQVTLGQEAAARCSSTRYRKCEYPRNLPTTEPDQTLAPD
jgi:hypothetical protein